MSSSSQASDTEHPLLRDRARFDNVLDVMYAAIQKVFFKNRTLVPRNSASERVIIGGASADDVLQEATLALLTHPDAEAVEDWCALGTVVAKNKAMDALDAARKHLSPTDHRVELYVVSGDVESSSPDGAVTTSVLQAFPVETSTPKKKCSRSRVHSACVISHARSLAAERRKFSWRSSSCSVPAGNSATN